jgi:K+-transporting ATPase ATPase C chain
MDSTALRTQIGPAAVLLILMTLLTGVVYPLSMTGLAHLLFADEAEGSLIVRDGRAVGSSLIGQPFDAPEYFWGRPSATAPFPYNAAASTGSNLGPVNPALRDAVRARQDALRDAVRARQDALRAADPVREDGVPVDLITASGSGLDPHISPAAAEWQMARVARARGLGEAVVREVARAHTEGRLLGIWGEPTVNVLELNLALDRLKTSSSTRPPGQ